MESESHFNEDAVPIQEQDLSKVESANQSPNFELRETLTFINEDNFDDGCSSTTGASGCRDSSVSPRRFGSNENEMGSERVSIEESDVIDDDDLKNSETKTEDNDVNDVTAPIVCTSESINRFSGESDFSSENAQVETLNTYTHTNNANKEQKQGDPGKTADPLGEDTNSIEFLSRQKALDRANVFLRWNLSPTRSQVDEFLDMAQGKLNLSMVSDKGYDYCLLYFELLRDGLIGYHLWGDVTSEQIEASISEARQTLVEALTPPQTNKRRNPNGDTLSEDNLGSYESDKVPLHSQTNSKRRNQSDIGDKDGYSGLQEISMASLNFALNSKNDESETNGTSIDSLEWQKTNSCKDSDTSNNSNNMDGSSKGSNIDKEENESDIDDNMQENEGGPSSRQDAMNRLLNPKSGCKGVSWSNRQMAWLAFWKEDNQRRSKTFSARKLGFEEAQRRAIEFLRRKREEVRVKTQAHLYEELPRVGSVSLNPSNDNSVIKTPSRRSYSNSNATTTATPATPITPSFELDQLSAANQFIPCMEESTRNLIAGTNPLFSAAGNILAANNMAPIINHGNSTVQQGVIQPGVGQQNILTATAAAAAAAHQLGLPFHLAALSSITGGIQMDPSLSATVAAAAGLGLQNPQQVHQPGPPPPMSNFAHAAFMAANPFFMFGAAAAAAAAAAANSNNGQLGPSGQGPHFPFQQFQGPVGPLVPTTQAPAEAEESGNPKPAGRFVSVGSKTSEQKDDVSVVPTDNNASNATTCATTGEIAGKAFEDQEKPGTIKSSLDAEVKTRHDLKSSLGENGIESMSKSEENVASLKALGSQVPPLEV
ncbi:hypothetical protein FG386_001955 [Cryptosporidium ryanae]|uniref:uncharacterized protein n=1 Tax=Cryptosporidium ryanae TaxID=515981 RepID=UPI00351A79E2|nr:hypothetical protein FG386_001955 [Cryptosporidium ryanae]